jgi:multiple sugar transport system permease protein
MEKRRKTSCSPLLESGEGLGVRVLRGHGAMATVIEQTERERTFITPKRRRVNRRALAGYCFVSPALLFLFVFALLPFLFTIWVSFHDWNMLTPIRTMPWTGLKNYRYLLFDDPLFRETLRNTVYYAVFSVSISVVVALIIALLLNGPIKLRAFWRAAFFIPYITIPVAMAIVWRSMLNQRYGMINGMLERFGLPEQPFLDSISQAMPSLIGIAIWQTLGYYMIIFLAGLQAIPGDLYEAARLDGANTWRLFWSITLPLLKPTLLFVIVINTLSSLQVFDMPFVLTNGGPVNSTNTMVLYMYDTAFNFLRMGRATAMAVLLFLIIFVITLIQLRLLRDET